MEKKIQSCIESPLLISCRWSRLKKQKEEPETHLGERISRLGKSLVGAKNQDTLILKINIFGSINHWEVR